MKSIALPFLGLTNDILGSKQIELAVGDSDLQKEPAFSEEWDNSKPVKVRWSFTPDLDKAAERLQIPRQEIRLRAFLRVGSGGMQIPSEWLDSKSYELLHGEQNEAYLEVEGSRFSGRAFVEAMVLLDGPVGAGSALSPKQQGDRLWERSFKTDLEGNGPRFPMEAVSFTEYFPGRDYVNAPWFLDWSPDDINRDFLGAVRLYINSDLESFVEKFANADPETVAHVTADMMSQVLAGSLKCDRFEDIEHADEGTLGQQVRDWHKLVFGSGTYSISKSLLMDNPGRFNAAVLATVWPGEFS